MKIFFIIILFITCSNSVFSQNQTGVVPKNHHNIYIDLFGIGYKYESALSEKYTLSVQAGLKATNIGYSASYRTYFGTEVQGGFFYSVSPFVGIEGRCYYPLKKLTYPASNFWALNATYYTTPVLSKNTTDNQYVFISPYWGVYRRLTEDLRFELDLGLNLGMNLIDSHFAYSPKVDVKFIYTF